MVAATENAMGDDRRALVLPPSPNIPLFPDPIAPAHQWHVVADPRLDIYNIANHTPGLSPDRVTLSGPLSPLDDLY